MKMKKIVLTLLVMVVAALSIVFFTGRGTGNEEVVPVPTPGHVAEFVFGTPTPQTAFVPSVVPLSIYDALTEQTPRDGYSLAPTLFSLTGIDPASSFVLRTPDFYGARMPDIIIDGQPPPTITREDGDTFLVTPAIPLTPNSIFVFRILRTEDADITWAFQTSVQFELSSTLPRNQATNVPVRTGIELTFSTGNEIDITEQFSIYPFVEGRFIHRDSTVIFMPIQPLKHGSVYTVTLNPGVRLPNSHEVLNTVHSFSFETESHVDQPPRSQVSSIHFSARYVEFPTFAAPEVMFWVNADRDTQRVTINMTLHRMDDQAITAVHRLNNAPHWSRIFQPDSYVNTSGLTRIFSVNHTSNRTNTWNWRDIFTLPGNLTPGFYVLTATVDNAPMQMIIQITDLAVQLLADDDKALLWINDMTTGQPVGGASVFDPVSNRTYNTSPYGIAIVDRAVQNGEHLQITAANGKESVLFIHTWWGSSTNANDRYWTAFQLDRTLFQRSDTVSLWGFVQNRQQEETITHVTAVISEGRWWWWHDSPLDTLHRQNIPVVNGAYSAEIRLPHLDPGFYEVAIYHGDILLNTMFFNVMDYVKPPYQLTMSTSRQAIFAGEEVTFTAGVEFFEGTPVPDLHLSYHSSAWELSSLGQAQGVTNLDGIVTFKETPTVTSADAQGERGLWVSVEATLPEIGWTHQSAYVRVFVNDIHVQSYAKRTDGNATLSVNINQITLDRLNDGTASFWGDYLCEPVANKRVTARIYEIYWEQNRTGERYCHITRQVIPTYRHTRREVFLQQFDMFTDGEGFAERDFTVPNRKNASYVARISTTDGNGRRIEHTVFIGMDFSWFFNNVDDGHMFLHGGKPEGYDIGDEVELVIMQGAEPVTRGNFLFVVVQNGIKSYHIGANTLAFTFGEQHIPNAQVYAYHFNGHTYHSGWFMSERIRFNTSTRNLLITVEACSEDYQPGDTVTLTVTATDTLGNPKAANINISLVDEALFALMDYHVDTLSSLYSSVNDRLRLTLTTHRTFVSGGLEDDASYMIAENAAPMALAADAARGADGNSGDTRIRERFEDTAIFASLRTNNQGIASFTFTLPDNITSWRMTASGISDTLYAGNSVQNIRVTLPMFLHYSMNNIFLVGDRPYIGVNVYGTSLSGGEKVTFEVWRDDMDNGATRLLAQGVAFERVNIPLWEMGSEGSGSLIIQANVDNGFSDAVRHTFTVVNSHRHVDVAKFYEVTPSTVFESNPTGLTNITFTNRGRGQFLNDLFGLRHMHWGSGARVEGLLARREATRLIETHFPDIQLFGEPGSFDVTDYQTETGGLAILPYAEADLQTTILLLPFVLDDVNRITLRRYLRTVYDTSLTDNKILALYGLAMMGEPVLLDLQRYALLPDLSVRNTAYLALAFAEIGETFVARELYTNRIAPHFQYIAPNYRVNAGANRAEILDATSVTALLAAKLGKPEALGLHNYARQNRVSTRNTDLQVQLNIERLLFISYEINNHSNETASITYTLFGETITRDLGHRGSFTLRIPTQNMHEFNLVSVTGEVGAVSIIRTPLENMSTVANDITVRREFFNAGSTTPSTTFNQGDLVRVQITVDYSSRDLSGSYIITDFLPAGLVHAPFSARFGDRQNTPGWHAWVQTEGQRITFYDHNGRFNRNHTYYYYARVVNPGTFTAEGTLVQSVGAREYMVAGVNTVLTIRGN